MPLNYDLTKITEELKKQQEKYKELETQLQKLTDFSSKEYINIQKQLSKIDTKINKLTELQRLHNQMAQAREILGDASNPPELLELARSELNDLKQRVEKLTQELFNPTAGIDNFIIEIRAGAGGEEAALFAHDLFRMYSLFLQDIGAKLEITDVSYSDKGGYKFISAYIKGDNVYHWFKYESGVHRVQRIPITESSGRIHTSTVSVAILPEYDDAPEIELAPKDLEITPIKASGPGGQHVNKNMTAIRIKHIPTGLIVTSQRYKSQKQNREFALKILKLKLLEAQRQQQTKTISDLRKQQIGTMDRSEKIRTYNFPQSRMTDHRIKKSWYNLDAIMDGKIKDILEDIITILDSETGVHSSE